MRADPASRPNTGKTGVLVPPQPSTCLKLIAMLERAVFPFKKAAAAAMAPGPCGATGRAGCSVWPTVAVAAIAN